MICDDDLLPAHSPQRQLAKAAPRITITAREAEILAAFAEGEREKVIAYRLGLSRRTIEGHVQNLRKKIGAKSIAHAAAMWAKGEIVVSQ